MRHNLDVVPDLTPLVVSETAEANALVQARQPTVLHTQQAASPTASASPERPTSSLPPPSSATPAPRPGSTSANSPSSPCQRKRTPPHYTAPRHTRQGQQVPAVHAITPPWLCHGPLLSGSQHLLTPPCYGPLSGGQHLLSTAAERHDGDHDQLGRQRGRLSSRFFKFNALIESVSSGAIKPLKGSYVLQLWRSGARAIERRHCHPPSAFWSAHELQATLEAIKSVFGVERAARVFGSLCVSFSYAWVGTDHPDPYGFHLNHVGQMAASYLEEGSPVAAIFGRLAAQARSSGRSRHSSTTTTTLSGAHPTIPPTHAYANACAPRSSPIGQPDFALCWDYACMEMPAPSSKSDPSLPSTLDQSSTLDQPGRKSDQLDNKPDAGGRAALLIWLAHAHTVVWMQPTLPEGSERLAGSRRPSYFHTAHCANPNPNPNPNPSRWQEAVLLSDCPLRARGMRIRPDEAPTPPPRHLPPSRTHPRCAGDCRVPRGCRRTGGGGDGGGGGGGGGGGTRCAGSEGRRQQGQRRRGGQRRPRVHRGQRYRGQRYRGQRYGCQR